MPNSRFLLGLGCWIAFGIVALTFTVLGEAWARRGRG